jgi:hypothetical protein
MEFIVPLAGWDGLENKRNMYPRALVDRLFGDGLPIARDRLIPGQPALLISVPFCGAQNCEDSSSELVGFFCYSFMNEVWGQLFRKHTRQAASSSITHTRARTHAHTHTQNTHFKKTASSSSSYRAVNMDGHEIGAAQSPHLELSHTAHVASLHIDLECFYDEPRLHLSHILLWLGGLGMVAVFFMLTMVQWREITLAETKGEQHRAAREEEASRIAALAAHIHSMETTERYIDHEVKNRLMVLEQIKLCKYCAKSPHQALVFELMETVRQSTIII